MAKLIIVLALLILPGKKNASKQFCNFPYSSSIKILRFSSSQRVPSHRPYLPLLISPPCGLHLVFHLFHPAIIFLFLIIPERIVSSNLFHIFPNHPNHPDPNLSQSCHHLIIHHQVLFIKGMWSPALVDLEGGGD